VVTVIEPPTYSTSNNVEAPTQSSSLSRIRANVSTTSTSGSKAARGGNGTSTSYSTDTAAASPYGAPSSNGNGRRALQRVALPSTPLKAYMPAVRSAATALSQELEVQQLPAPSPSAPPAELLDTRQFSWAQDSYSPLQRSLDTWLFFIRFRSSLYLLDKKWSYAGQPRSAPACAAG
jgi:hypothetical protein